MEGVVFPWNPCIAEGIKCALYTCIWCSYVCDSGLQRGTGVILEYRGFKGQRRDNSFKGFEEGFNEV